MVNLNLITILILLELSLLLVVISEGTHSFLEKPKCFPISFDRHPNEYLSVNASSYIKINDLLLMCEYDGYTHFQHFAFCLFPYLNIITNLIDIGEIGTENIPKLAFKTGSNYFDKIENWIKSILVELKPVLGDFYDFSPDVTFNNKSNLMINHKEFLLDRSFTLRLSSFLNHVDICQEIERVLQSSAKINVLIIDRTNLRKLENIKEVKDILKGYVNVTPNVAYFEKSSFSDQLEFIRSSDIVISAHGAALTNAFALPLCGQLIEIFPYGYCAYVFYSRMNIDRHFIYDDVSPHNIHPDCLKELNVTISRNESDEEVPGRFCHPAMFHYSGRKCLRMADVHVNLSQLIPVFQNAIEARLECLMRIRSNYTG